MPYSLPWNRLLAALSIALAVTVVAVDHADARRGGSFGSRGARTFQLPPATRTAPQPSSPIERSMTPRTQTEQPYAQRQTGPVSQQPSLFGGSRGLIGGLLAGGLIGWLLGSGFGGAAGFLTALLQIGVVVLGAMLLFLLFRRREQPSYAGAGANYQVSDRRIDLGQWTARPDGSMLPPIGSARSEPSDEIGVTQSDLDTFERLLKELQTAYGREDFSKLRELTTPEIMSYLAEELADNASQGVKNVVSDVELLQGDLAEAWREGDEEYATAAMRYSSIDSLKERDTGRVVAGHAEHATETTEVWTFVRRRGTDWKVAAIQEA